MTRSRFLFFLASTAIVLPILAGSLLGAAVDDEPGEDSFYKYLSVFTDSLGLVQQAYVEETDVDTLMAAALDGVTDGLDPTAVYVPADAVSDYLAARDVGTSRSGLVLMRERGMVYVMAVLPDSPAEAAGLQQGDLVAEIDGRETRVVPMWEVQEMLAGDPGTKVHLHLVRYAETRDADLTLGTFPEPAPGLEEHDGVPVLTIPLIDSDTAGRVAALLDGLGDHEDLVVDLRGTAGGDAEAAYAVAGLFADGELGHLNEKGEDLETYRGDGEPAWTGRILVLTDRSTFGPAELIASILRQRAGAELVGGRTFGFAGRQSMIELSSGAVVFLADALYTGPDADPLNEPLEPDERVADRMRSFSEIERAQEQDAEKAPDRVLERALELLAEPAQPSEEAAAEKKVAA